MFSTAVSWRVSVVAGVESSFYLGAQRCPRAESTQRVRVYRCMFRAVGEENFLVLVTSYPLYPPTTMVEEEGRG